MGKKNIIHTNHSMRRKYERNISDGEIEQTLNGPDYTLSSAECRKIAIKRIKDRTIHVVYKEERGNIIVITVY
jgi:hypothetical protein